MDKKTNPKPVGNKLLQKVYPTPAMDEIVWRKMSVTMYRNARRHNCENVKFGIRNVI